jgi:hypothetical protein
MAISASTIAVLDARDSICLANERSGGAMSYSRAKKCRARDKLRPCGRSEPSYRTLAALLDSASLLYIPQRVVYFQDRAAVPVVHGVEVGHPRWV